MIFAIIYILFFVFDILVFHGFLIFGMLPMEYFVPSVGIFVGVICLKNRRYFPSHPVAGALSISLYYIIYLSIYGLCKASIALFHAYQIFQFTVSHSKEIGIFNIILQGSIISMMIFTWRMKEPLYRWLLISFVAILMNELIMDFFVFSSLMYRYSGFLELPKIFSWLMMVHYILRKKYGNIEEMTEEMAPTYRQNLKGSFY